MIEQTPQDAALEAVGLGPTDEDNKHEESTDATDSVNSGVVSGLSADDGGSASDLPAGAGDIPGDDTAAAEKPIPADKEEKTDGLSDADLEKPKRGEKSAERWQKMSAGYRAEREAKQGLETQVAHYQESIKALQDLGFDSQEAAQDLVEFSKYRDVLKTGDVEAFSAMVSQQIQQFEEFHGKRPKISGGILDKYPELKAKVDDFDLDEDVATEIARGRSLQERVQRETTRRDEFQQVERDNQDYLNTVVDEVAALQAGWAKNDPDYAAVLPHLQAKMAGISTRRPELWVDAVRDQYETIRGMLVESAKTGRGQQPLRGNGRALGNVMVPQNPQQAALAAMGFDIGES